MPLITPSMFCWQYFSEIFCRGMKKLEKDREELLVFYNFLSANSVSIRTTNSIEFTFTRVRLWKR
ncbi:MAG: hypothetical protein ACTS73_02170 [Arsenophonus sp. NEOnobi-MAG3]